MKLSPTVRWARIPFVAAAVVLAVGAGAAPVAAAPGDPAPLHAASGRAIPDAYVVVLHDGADARAVAGRNGVRPAFVYGRAVTGFAATLSSARLAAVRADPAVRYVERDGVASVADDARGETAEAAQTGAPWGLDRIDQRTGTDSVYRYTDTAPGVTAYVIDTGIHTAHTQFGARAAVGFDAIGDGRNGADCNGHGTHVAGTVGGTRYGVAKSVRLVAVRVLDCSGNGPWSAVLAGVDWVTAHHSGPSVATMSLSGGRTRSVEDAVARSIAQGVTYAVAAGNENADACGFTPGATPGALTVAATALAGGRDVRAGYSNYGRCVDVFAPGSDITSAWIGSTTATNTLSGTSMAVPHVAGLAALYLQSSPRATPATVAGVLRTTAVRGVVGSPSGSPNLFARKWTGSLAAPGVSAYQPDGGDWYQAHAGYVRGWLAGTPGTNADLYLERWNGSAWSTVAAARGTTARESLVHAASGAARYRFRVHAVAGSGGFDLWSSHPG